MIAASLAFSGCAGYTTAASAGAASPENVAAGVLSPSANSLNFGNVAVGSTATQTVSVTNTGTAPVNISQAAITGSGFAMMNGSGTTSVPVGQSVSVQIQFSPTSEGNDTATLNVISDASNSPLAISLSGMGSEASVALSPALLNFNNVPIGQSSSQNVTITNNGNSNLTFSSATISGSGFTMSGLTPFPTIPGGQSVTFSVQFAPTSGAGATGSIVFRDNAGNSPQTLTLNGSAVATGSTLTPNPGSANFGNVAVGSSSTQTIALTNSGGTNITIQQLSTTGSGFSTNGISAEQTIAAGGTANFSVTFAPEATGTVSGTILISSTATNGSLSLPLSGTGTQGALSASPASISFGNVAVGSTSAPATITLSNTGTAAVSITGSSITGAGFSMSTLSAQTLNPGQTTSFAVRFAPTTGTSVSGSVSVASNAPGSPLTIALSGTGTQGALSVNPSSVSFGSVAVGSTSAPTMVTLSDTGTAPVSITGSSITGAGFSMSTLSAQTLSPGQTTSFSITFAPITGTSVSGSVSITSSAPGSPLTIALSGTGTVPVFALSPASLNFNNVPVGQKSSQTVTLTNSGNSNLTVNSAMVSGTGFTMSGLTLPKTISSGQSATFSVQFAPTSTTGVSGSIVFADNAGNSPQTLTLTGSAVASGSTLTASPGSVNFGSVVVGASGTQTITLTNSGTASITINQVSATGSGFSATGLSANQTIAASGTANFSVTFAPAATGTVLGTILISSTATNGSLSLPLSGTGTQGALSASPSSVSFGNVAVGSTSTATTVTLSNTGTAAVSITGSSITGAGFSMSTLSAQTLNPGQTASFTVTFAPTTATSVSGSTSITSNAPGSPLTIALSGTGTQGALSASPSSVSFGDVTVGSTSAPTTVTLSNTGTAAVSITGSSITGTGFSMSALSAQTLNPGQTTSFTVTFAPTTATSVTGSASVTSNAPGSPLKFALSGTGTQGALSASPSSVSFGNVAVGSTSTATTVTLSNTGTAAVSITGSSITGAGFSMSTLSAQTLNPGQTASFTVTFAPTTATSVTGSVSVTSNAPGSPLTIALSGTGTQGALSASPSSVSFGNVAVGSTSAPTMVTLSNTGAAAVSITGGSITGSGFSMSSLSAQTVNPGQTASFTVTFAPTTATTVGGTVSVTSNAPGSPLKIALSGAGTQPQISASLTSVNFGTVTVGSSNSLPITLTNNGNATLTFSQITVSGTGFSQTGLSMSSTIAAGASVTLNAVFTPSSATAVSGSITLATNGTPSPLVINLSGTGAAVVLSLGANPTSLAFGNVTDGSSSSLTTSLTNNGNSNITISGVSVAGAGFSTSGISNGTVLTPGQSATLTVTFAPTTAGAVSGATVTITSNATNSPAQISLSGTGTAYSVLLEWTASPTAGVTYNIFRGTSSGGESTTPLNTSSVSTTSYTDNNVTSGQTYYYTVEAVDSAGSSAPSNQAEMAIPAP